MTLSRWRKVVETPEGTGQVSTENRVVAAVSYALRVEVEELVAKSFAGEPKSILRQDKFITGTMSVSDGDVNLGQSAEAAPSSLTLLLEDGRAVAFEVVHPDSGDGEYVIRGIGDFRQAQQ